MLTVMYITEVVCTPFIPYMPLEGYACGGPFMKSEQRSMHDNQRVATREIKTGNAAVTEAEDPTT